MMHGHLVSHGQEFYLYQGSVHLKPFFKRCIIPAVDNMALLPNPKSWHCNFPMGTCPTSHLFSSVTPGISLGLPEYMVQARGLLVSQMGSGTWTDFNMWTL